MARTRGLIPSIEVRPAKKLSRCTHNKKHLIPQHSMRFVVKEPGGLGEKGYCTACAHEMLLLARQRLDELGAALEVNPSSA